MTTQITTQQIEQLGPAERIINALLTHVDHSYHGRPGVVSVNGGTLPKWTAATFKMEAEQKLVYLFEKVGNKNTRRQIGALLDDGRVMLGRTVVGEYRQPGLFPEVVVHLYKQIAEVWKLDNEFAARWASYAFTQDHRDMKCLLAAFMLVQSRKGDPVMDAGKVAFFDEDFRDVGEAMALIVPRGAVKTKVKAKEKDVGNLQAKKDTDNTFNAKMIARVGDMLMLPGVAAINRELGFGRSAKSPHMGRWPTAVQKWLRYREENPKMLQGLVEGGFRSTVINLARRVRYKPTSPAFFETLRWKQDQAADGRRSIAIGVEVAAAESWKDLSETEICEKIVQTRPSYKRLTGMLPKTGLTRAIMAAAIEAGSVGTKDLIILTPTLEDLGLLQVQDIRERWEKATREAQDTRAANIAMTVKSKEIKEKLTDAADTAMKKAVEEVTRGMRLYFLIDISGSMNASIDSAKRYLAQFLQAFPMDRLHVAVFNTSARIIEIKVPSAAGVENAFRGITAGGGTAHRTGVAALAYYKPKDDEDVLLVVVGDEGEQGSFDAEIRAVGLRPMAIGLLKVPGQSGTCVQETARKLGVPLVPIDEKIFADPYAIPRTLRNMIAATPVGTRPVGSVAPRRESLVEIILKTPLLSKPAWA